MRVSAGLSRLPSNRTPIRGRLSEVTAVAVEEFGAVHKVRGSRHGARREILFQHSTSCVRRRYARVSSHECALHVLFALLQRVYLGYGVATAAA